MLRLPCSGKGSQRCGERLAAQDIGAQFENSAACLAQVLTRQVTRTLQMFLSEIGVFV